MTIGRDQTLLFFDRSGIYCGQTDRRNVILYKDITQGRKKKKHVGTRRDRPERIYGPSIDIRTRVILFYIKPPSVHTNRPAQLEGFRVADVKEKQLRATGFWVRVVVGIFEIFATPVPGRTAARLGAAARASHAHAHKRKHTRARAPKRDCSGESEKEVRRISVLGH